MSANPLSQQKDPILHVTDASYDADVQQSKGALVLDFWAPWCGPCRSLGKSLETLAPEFAGRVRVAKINVDENPQVASAFGVQSIPTLVFFRDGQPVAATRGALPLDVLRDLFTKHENGELKP